MPPNDENGLRPVTETLLMLRDGITECPASRCNRISLSTSRRATGIPFVKSFHSNSHGVLEFLHSAKRDIPPVEVSLGSLCPLNLVI